MAEIIRYLDDKNDYFQMSEDERRLDRSIIGAKLIRRLSLRPTAEELLERNILKSKLVANFGSEIEFTVLSLEYEFLLGT